MAQRRCGMRGVEQTFDHLGVAVGASMLEEAVGTNAPGTVLETRASIAVNGQEHFAVPLRDFAATATRSSTPSPDGSRASSTSPIPPRTPTRSCSHSSPAPSPTSSSGSSTAAGSPSAAAARVPGGVRPTPRGGRGRRRPADDQPGGPRPARLHRRRPAPHAGPRRRRRRALPPVALESGVLARVRVEPVSRTRGGALLHVEPLARPRSPRNRTLGTPMSVTGRPALVTGPPGSGRRTSARRLAATSRSPS